MGDLLQPDSNRTPQFDDLQQLMETTADDRTRTEGENPPEDANSLALNQDSPPSISANEVNIPDEELSEYLQATHKNELQDKEDSGFSSKLAYDTHAYYELQNEEAKHYPYENASAWPVSLTSAIMDTLHAMVDDFIWRNSGTGKVVTVTPVGDLNRSKARNLESVMNWQNINGIRNHELQDSEGNFFMLLHGNQYETLIRTENAGVVEPVNIPVEFV